MVEVGHCRSVDRLEREKDDRGDSLAELPTVEGQESFDPEGIEQMIDLRTTGVGMKKNRQIAVIHRNECDSVDELFQWKIDSPRANGMWPKGNEVFGEHPWQKILYPMGAMFSSQ